jgi:hypothetical protein
MRDGGGTGFADDRLVNADDVIRARPGLDCRALHGVAATTDDAGRDIRQAHVTRFRGLGNLAPRAGLQPRDD